MRRNGEATADAAATGQRTGSDTGRLVRWFGALAGCVGLVAGGNSTASGEFALAQAAGYRASKDAPTAWRDFAVKLQARLQELLAADDEQAHLLHQLLEARRTTQASDETLAAKVWVTPSGHIERLEFDAVDHEIVVALRHVFMRANVNVTPPADMLQPLQLRLSLRDAG